MAGRTLHYAVEEAIALHRAAVDRVMLRTIYINPTFAINGDGSTWTQAASNGAPGACNAWGTGTYGGTFGPTQFWRDRTRYLQAAETEVPTVTVYATDGSPMQGIVLGTYDPATGEQIRDGTRHARIWRATGGTALALGTAATNRRNMTVDNLDIRMAERTMDTGFRFGVSFNAVRYDEYIGVAVIRCILDGFRSVSGGGAGVKILGNDFNGWGSGFEIQSTDVLVLGNAVYHPEWETRQEWAALTHTTPYDASYTVERLVVEYNDFRKLVMSQKECINIQCTPAGNTQINPPSGPVTIRHNQFSGEAQQVRTTIDNAEIAFNTFDRIHNVVDPTVNGNPAAIALHAKNAFIHDNFVYSPPDMPYGAFVNITYGATTGTNRVYRNTVIGTRRMISCGAPGAAFNLDVRDNVFVRSTYQGGTDTAAFMAMLGTIAYTASNNLYYGTNEGAIQFNVLGVNRTFAQYQSAVESTATFAVPGYDTNYHPAISGNLAFAGSTGGGFDLAGMAREYPTSIGAVETVRQRQTRTLP